MHATAMTRPFRLYDDRTPRRAHFERMLAYVVCASALVLPLFMAPVNAFFAHVVYRVGSSAPGYPVHVENGVYPILDATAWPFVVYWMLSLPFWLALFCWAVFMMVSARDVGRSRGWRWRCGQWMVLFAPFGLNAIAFMMMWRWGVAPD